MQTDNFMASMNPIGTPKHDIEHEFDRHRNRVKNIIRNSGMDEVIDQYQAVADLEHRRSELRSDIRDAVKKILTSMSSRKTLYIKQKITLRDGDIYRHGDSRRLKMPQIAKYMDHGYFSSEEKINGGDALQKIRDAIKRCDFGTSSYNQDRKIQEYVTTTNTIEGFDKAVYKNSRLYVKNSDKWSSKVELPIDDMVEHGEAAVLMSELELNDTAKILALKPELMDVLETVENELKREVSARQDALDIIKDAGAKHLVMKGL